VAFAVFTVKADDFELGYSIIRVAVNFGLAGLFLGINVLGIALVLWLVRLRRSFPTGSDLASRSAAPAAAPLPTDPS
jgi:hypothetical protein